MTPDLNDDLSDLLGGEPATTPKTLPMDEASVRMRAAASPLFMEACKKCRGTGRFISYSGRALGPCFACKGAGKKAFKTAPEVRSAARERTAVAKAGVIADHQAELKWLNDTLSRRARLPEGYATMLADFQSRLQAGRELTDGQMAVIRRGMERSAQWAAERAQRPAEQAAALEVAAIREALKNRRKVMVAEFTFSLAPAHGNNPGAIYVKDRGQYIGKIAAGEATFRPVRDFDQSRLQALREVMANPGEAVRADAARRAKLLAEDRELEVPCGCCGILLTDPVSRARGIGPICAGKWGF